MAFWWERYTTNPDNNTSSPPDGAPENHFPDQVNNISRQAMAAIAEIGAKVLGAGDGSDPPQVDTTIAGPFLKVVYDELLPVGSIRAADTGGTYVYPVSAKLLAEGVVWGLCDGQGGRPNFENRDIVGVQFTAGAGQNVTGTPIAAAQTGLGGEIITTDIVTGSHALTEAELAAHGHGGDTNTKNSTLQTAKAGQSKQDGDHTHPDATTTGTFGKSGGTQPGALGGGTAMELGDLDIKASNSEHIHDVVGKTADAGSGDGHTHKLDTLTIPDHKHDAGRTPAAALELYIRTA